MEVEEHEVVVGRHCRLLRPIRDHEGQTHFNEPALIVRDLLNLGRRMLLVKFEDGSSTFLFPNEVALD